MVDLSRLGAWLRTNNPLQVGELVELTFAEHVALRAEVMWTRSGKQGGMGVEFIDVDERSRHAIDAIVTEAPAVDGGDPKFTFADAY